MADEFTDSTWSVSLLGPCFHDCGNLAENYFVDSRQECRGPNGHGYWGKGVALCRQCLQQDCPFCGAVIRAEDVRSVTDKLTTHVTTVSAADEAPRIALDEVGVLARNSDEMLFTSHLSDEAAEVLRYAVELLRNGTTREGLALIERAQISVSSMAKAMTPELFKLLSGPDVLSALQLSASTQSDMKDRKVLICSLIEYGKGHLEDLPLELAVLHVNLADVLSALGDFQGSLELLQIALAVEEKHYGPHHPSVAFTVVRLAVALGKLGNEDSMRDNLLHAKRIYEHHNLTKSADMVSLLMNLGMCSASIGDHQAALTAHEEALAIAEVLYKPDSGELAPVLINLGNACDKIGDHKRKILVTERALRIQETKYGQNNPDVARTLSNLACSYGTLGDLRKQSELLKKSLRVLEELYGLEHTEVAIVLGNLAMALGTLGDLHSQQKMLERSLRIDEKHYGPNHIRLAPTLTNLANTYADFGDNEKRWDICERVFKMEEQRYGSDNINVVGNSVALASAYGALGDPHKQCSMLLKVLRIEEAHYGHNHLELVSTLSNLGIGYKRISDGQKELVVLERALAIQESQAPGDTAGVATVLQNLSTLYLQTSPGKALAMLQRTFEINLKIVGKDHVKMSRVFSSMAAAHHHLGDSSVAYELTKLMVQIEKRHYGEDHPEISTTLQNLEHLRGQVDRDGLQQKRFSNGRNVFLHGLADNPGLNGKTGTILGYLPEKKRFKVKIAEKEQALRPTNLVLDETPPGCCVILHSLSASKYNRQRAIVIRFVLEKQRYTVHLLGEEREISACRANFNVARIPMGCHVRAEGLLQAPDYNNKAGVVVGYELEKDRYMIEFGCDKKSLRLENLNPCRRLHE